MVLYAVLFRTFAQIHKAAGLEVGHGPELLDVASDSHACFDYSMIGEDTGKFYRKAKGVKHKDIDRLLSRELKECRRMGFSLSERGPRLGIEPKQLLFCKLPDCMRELFARTHHVDWSFVDLAPEGINLFRAEFAMQIESGRGWLTIRLWQAGPPLLSMRPVAGFQVCE